MADYYINSDYGKQLAGSLKRAIWRKPPTARRGGRKPTAASQYGRTARP